MQVDKIGRLIQALSNAAQNQTKTAPVDASEAKASQQSSAVKLSDGFGTSVDEASSARQERVAQIKEQVASGTYQPDTYAVASAVARELFT